MRIRSISIYGFRGFNDKKDFVFDDRLTLIAAVNSYGKTSISEAFEWLLYGQTSKVEKADSKDEYKGSYRNCHLPPAAHPKVILVLDDQGVTNTLEAELIGDDIRRTRNDLPVSEWLFSATLKQVPKPFILQHALKNLLLAKPVDRFTDFARLLGFEELGDLRKEVIALCTQFHLPHEVDQLVSSVDALQSRVQSHAAFAQIAKELRKGAKRVNQAYELVKKECARRAPRDTDPSSFLAQLLRIRRDAVGKIFKGSVALSPYLAQEQAADSKDETVLLSGVSENLTTRYSTLIALKAQRSISDLACFYTLGVKLLGPAVQNCPFCLKDITSEDRDHILQRHSNILERSKAVDNLGKHVVGVQQEIRHLQERLHALFTRDFARTTMLLAAESSLPQIEMLLGVKHQAQCENIRVATDLIKKAKARCDEALAAALGSFVNVLESIDQSTEGLELLTTAGQRVVEAVAAARDYRAVLQEDEHQLSEAEDILKRELDALAGMQEVSTLIDLLEQQADVEKRFRIADIVDSLKELRSGTEEFVGARMLAAISGDFTDEVMQWYGKIRTTGDPDVHFAGFDMKKIASGNRVQIKATSYWAEPRERRVFPKRIEAECTWPLH